MKKSNSKNEVTIQDVARRAGISITTVSRVINNSKHKVNAETRKRVLAAVAALDYRPNTLARGLTTRQTQTVGVIIPDISNPYYAEVVRGMQDVAEERGYSITLQNTDRRQYRIINDIRMLRSKMVDGIIFSGGNISGQSMASVKEEMGERVVVVGRHPGGFPAVLVDNILGAREAVLHLAALGHKLIGHIGGPTRSTTAQDRLKGYKKALAAGGIEFDKKFVKRGNLTPESGYRCAQEMLDTKTKPTAILAANDLMAFGAVCAAKERGLQIPKDLAVVGFDNVPLCPYFDPPLTTVAIPMYNLGAAAMAMIVDIVSGQPYESQVLMETTLIIRASTGGPDNT